MDQRDFTFTTADETWDPAAEIAAAMDAVAEYDPTLEPAPTVRYASRDDLICILDNRDLTRREALALAEKLKMTVAAATRNLIAEQGSECPAFRVQPDPMEDGHIELRINRGDYIPNGPMAHPAPPFGAAYASLNPLEAYELGSQLIQVSHDTKVGA